MSECNWCRWQRYKAKGHREATAKDRKAWEADEKFTDTFGSGVVIVNKDGEFVAWFMELSDRCEC